MALLFRAHRDLLEEFTYFLPDSSPPQQPQQARASNCMPLPFHCPSLVVQEAQARDWCAGRAFP